jgi:transposase
MVRWAQQIAERRGKQIAIVALARKIAGVLFALWRDGTTYRVLANRQATAA